MKKKLILSNFAIVAIVCVAAARAGAENIPSVSNLLDRYTEALDSTSSFIDHYEMRRKFSYDMINVQNEGEKIVYGQYRHDNQRIYHHTYRWGDFRDAPLPKDTPYYNINIADGREGMTYQNHGIPKTYGTKALGVHSEKPFKINLTGYPGVGYLAGYIDSNERLDNILSKADSISVRETTENIRGSECFVIDADTKFGQYTVWLDPEHGYHPAKVTNKSGEGDQRHHYIHPEGYTGSTYVDIVRFEKIDGIWVPMEAEEGLDKKFADGRFEKTDTHYKRTQIILNPDHDKLGSFADPIFEDPSNDPELVNGTTIVLEELPITYTWQDGELIPNVDKEVVKQLDEWTQEVMAEESSSVTASDLLGKYAATQDKLQSFIAKGGSEIEKNSSSAQSSLKIKASCEFRFDGDRVSHRTHSWNDPEGKEKGLYESFLWDGKSFIEYTLRSKIANSGRILISNNDASKTEIITTRYRGAALMGFYRGVGERIDRVLSKADSISLQEELETIGDSKCYVIEARIKEDAYKIWIDPEHGHNIARSQVQKRTASQHLSFSLKNVSFESIEGVWVPMEGNMEESITSNGKTHANAWLHKRTSMLLNPDHEKLDSFVADDIKDGTKVNIIDRTDNYIWQDGRPVAEEHSNVE